MTNSLPSGININLIANEAERSRVLAYYHRFVEQGFEEYGMGHWIFAAYAAVPVLLTPELLYKIWINFRAYFQDSEEYNIHRIAVADVLLSSMCKEVGYELYEMQPDTRNFLISWLHNQTLEGAENPMQLHSPEKLARFIIEYMDQLPPELSTWGPGYSEAHLWNAYSIFYPEKAQQLLLEKLRATQGALEKIRVLEAFKRTGNQLSVLFSDEQIKSQIPDFQNIASLAGAWSMLIQQNPEAFVKTIEQSPDLKSYLKNEKTEGAIEVSIEVKNDQAERLERVRTTVHAIIVGIDSNPEYATSQKTNSEAAVSMSQFLQDYAAQKGYNTRINLMINQQFTYSAITQELERIQDAADGDLYVFYFAGNLIAHVSDPNLTFFLFEKTASEQDYKTLNFSQVVNKHWTLVIEKNVHCLVILDHTLTISDKFEITPQNILNAPSKYKGTMVTLGSGFTLDNTRIVHNGPFNECIFTTSLIDILKEGSTDCSYRSLITKVKLRVMQRERLVPVMDAIPSIAADYRFLSNQFEKKESYKVQFDSEHQEWRLLAGSLQGIRPSLGFMHTLLKLGGEDVVTIQDVFETYSTFVYFPKKNTSEQFEGYLLQNALPKVPMALSPDLPSDLRSSFEQAVVKYNIYYINLVQDTKKAKYYIQNRSVPVIGQYNNFGLFLNTPGFQALRPVFGYQDEAFEFIKQLEYIAQWAGVLEYDKQGGLSKNSVKVNFEVIEGVLISPENLNDLKGTPVENTELIEIKFVENGEELLNPAIRCRVTNNSEGLLYINALYLTDTFGITILTGGLAEPGKEIHTSFETDKHQFNAIPIVFNERTLKRGITDSIEYLKIIISDKPIDLEPLRQEDLSFEEVVKFRAAEFASRRSINLSGIEWTSITFPLRLSLVQQFSKSTDPNPESEQSKPNNPSVSTLQALIEQEKEIPLRDLAQPQYAGALAELRAKLSALGLLDPLITGNTQPPFKPGKEGFNSMEDTLTAQYEFCEARGFTFEKETLTPGLLKALLEAEPDTMFPLQLQENVADSSETRLAKAVLRQMQTEGFWIARSPNMYNVVYAEGINPDGTPNDNKMDEWNDLRLLIRIAKDGQPELVANDACTTEPGEFYTQNPLNPLGAAHIAPGQYKAWALGIHKGRLPALVQRDNIRIHRDQNKSGHRNAGDPIEVGATFGINQHGTGRDTPPDRVGQFGAGALVGQDNERHLTFMSLVQKDIRFKRNAGYLFMAAILEAGSLALSQNTSFDKQVSLLPDIKIIQKMITGNKLNMTAISWHSLLIQAAKAVGRVVVGDKMGTGFLLKGGYLLTANHVLSDKNEAERARLDMNYEMDEKGNLKTTVSYKFETYDMVTSPVNELNFTYIKVFDREDAPLSQWGYLELEESIPVQEKDSVVIIHHPRGEGKKISLEPEGINRIDLSKNELYYTNDTEPGSSGAPVLNSVLRVIGLHVSRMRDQHLNTGRSSTAISAYIRKAREKTI